MVKAAFDNIHYVPPFLIKIPSPHLRVKMGTYYIFAPSNFYTAPLVSGNIFMFIINQKGKNTREEMCNYKLINACSSIFSIYE